MGKIAVTCSGRRAGSGAMPRGIRAVAALEFALIAPVIATIFIGTLDIARAYIAWEEVNNAAGAIVQAAEKISASGGGGTAQLTYTQMQAAMSTIYVEMPGLDYGKGDGLLGKGAFAVTLSEVDYSPKCATTSGCQSQTPSTLWSSYLAEGGTTLDQTPTAQAPLLRACGALTPVGFLPNDSTQLQKFPTPTMDWNYYTGASSTPSTQLTLVPQLIADVQFTFIPSLPGLIPNLVFRASATLPAPVGGTKQEVAFLQTAPLGNAVYCGPVS